LGNGFAQINRLAIVKHRVAILWRKLKLDLAIDNRLWNETDMDRLVHSGWNRVMRGNAKLREICGEAARGHNPFSIMRQRYLRL
jgi:hypothetical protein